MKKIRKRKDDSVMKRKTVFANMEQLRKQNGKYDIIVLDIEKAIAKRAVASKNKERPKKLKMYFLGISMTEEEIDVLEKYLTKKYAHIFKGDVICIKKFLLKEFLKITSQSYR